MEVDDRMREAYKNGARVTVTTNSKTLVRIFPTLEEAWEYINSFGTAAESSTVEAVRA